MILLCRFELFTAGRALPVFCMVLPAMVGNGNEEASGETIAVSHIPNPSKAHSKGSFKVDMASMETRKRLSKKTNKYADDFSQTFSSHLLLVVS